MDSEIRGTGYLAGRSGRIGGFLLILFSAAALPTTNAWAQTLTTLYSFTGANGDGSEPIAGLVADASGNLYGTTASGGLSQCSSGIFGSGCGVVFELMPPTSPNGTWTEKIIYKFTGGSDGAQPWAGLIVDKSGNLYGTAAGGGQSACSGIITGTGCGVVFELVNSSGTYTYKVIHSFTDPLDSEPLGGLIQDAAGNLYGTTIGTVFELMPPASPGGAWTESVLYTFTGKGDGALPFAGLVQDASGNLYGTTAVEGLSGGCGLNGCGTVFKLAPPASPGDTWNLTTIYSFTGINGDGGNPMGALILDASGNLYGTTNAGGLNTGQCFPFPFTQTTGCGTVFELVNSSGTYTEKILYSFTGGNDGGNPYNFSAGLIADASGDLYGTTALGGSACLTSFNCGVVFKLTPPTSPGGNWTETVPHAFTVPGNGTFPFASLIADASGNLYGTTAGGYLNQLACGSSNCGTVFKLSGSGFVPPVHFAGVPGTPNCTGVSVSTLAHTYGGVAAAAKALGYSSVSALQSAIAAYCGN